MSNLSQKPMQDSKVAASKMMKEYVGTKYIKARPMTKAEYCAYRGWEIPKDEDPNEEVMLVEYPVDKESKPNHVNHNGYISMSPKHVFEKAYKEINQNSLGAGRVQAKFNPAELSIVDEIKNKSAELIDLIEKMRGGPEAISGEKHRVISIAQTEIETACMYAVKANFIN